MADSPAPEVVATRQEWPDWPAYALIDDLLPTLERWSAQGRRFALATLIQVTGSSPRAAGSEMAVAEDGECAGYVSGGCVEAAVAVEARAAMADGRPRLLDFGAGSPVLDVRLSCGGRIAILVREVADGAAHVDRLRAARNERRALNVSTELSTGAMTYAAPSDDSLTEGFHDGGARYRKRYLPPLRMVLVGNDPVILALLVLATSFSIEAVLLRPNGPASVPQTMPQPASYDRRGIDAALRDLHLDERCAIYTLSHDAEIDHAVLAHGLRSQAFCIGALGSRRKADMRRLRLQEEGFDAPAMTRLHTPAGLRIGARTPQEIALSILAEVIAERGRR